MRYQLVEKYGQYKHAGSKAKNDCIEILDTIGFKKIDLIRKEESNTSVIAKLKRQIDLFLQWKKIYRQLVYNDTLLIQHPFLYRDIGRNYFLKKIKNKNIKLILLVHDIEMIRNLFEKNQFKDEFHQMISVTDYFIIHNENMKKWLVDYGIDSNKLIVLGIFDYLNDKATSEKISFDKTVNIAGNLSREKSPYIYELSKIPDIKFNLMGINYLEKEEISNIHYLGAFESDEVPHQLNNGFGLIWDGTSIETCDGPTGNYLRYNNPHKLSLYLSSGLPVIVWKDSALSTFVESQKIGLVISSLYELSDVLENITEEQYYEFVSNINELRQRLKSGYYLKEAVKKIVD